MDLLSDNGASAKIKSCPFPYFYLLDTSEDLNQGVKAAVFLGNDFKNMSETLDREKYIEQTNLCLEYMRKNCKGLTLYYKPHPNETDEYTYFNLEKFEVIKKADNEVAEIFFWKNINTIQYAFTIASGAGWSAYKLGLNAYTFVKPVEAAIGKDIGSALDYYNQLPKTFFIENYDAPLIQNRKTLLPSEDLEKILAKDLEGSADIWMVVGDPGLFVTYISFVRLIRKIFPQKKINLIIPLHPRWKMVKKENYEKEFDTILVFPRCFYSLRPKRFSEIMKTVFAVKKLKFDPKDVFLLFANTNLVENCLLSFFKNKKIAIQPRDYFEINYGIKEAEVHKGEKLTERLSTRIFNTVIEPVLGLNRSTYLEYGDGRIINIVRFIKPATEIYDRIFMLE